MTKVSKETGLNKESLYRALKEDENPKINIFYKVPHAVGIMLLAIPENRKAT